MGRLIGIDFGTSNTVAAVAYREPQVVINEIGSRLTPSVVGFSRKGDRYVGAIAKRQMMVDPDHTVHDIKRFLGRRLEDAWENIQRVPYKVLATPGGGIGVQVDDRVYSVTELAAMILATIKKSSEEQLSEWVTDVVLTVPAHFSDTQREALRDAGTLAGLDVVRIINEPTAAALAWFSKNHRAATLAIYDFGGATFTASIVSVGPQGAQIRAVSTNTRLGGDDLDGRIIQWLIEEFYTEHRFDVSQYPSAMQRLKEAAERAKLELSTADTTEIRLPFLAVNDTGPKHIQKTLTRAFFEATVDEVFQRTLQECETCLRDAGLKPHQVDEVVMVGGSSRIPRVQELVAQLFRRPISKSWNPEEILAIGAAVQGWLLSGADTPSHGGQVLALSLGIEVDDGRFARLLPRNTPLPAEVRKALTPLSDGHSTVRIHILQGESPRARENTSVGELELVGLPRGQVQLELTFKVDEAGVVVVSANEPRSGITGQVTIAGFASLIRREALRQDTTLGATGEGIQEDEEIQKLRLTLEHQILDLEQLRGAHQGQLAAAELREVDAALKRGRMAMIKSSGRVDYFEEISHYIYHFYTNLCSKLGIPANP